MGDECVQNLGSLVCRTRLLLLPPHEDWCTTKRTDTRRLRKGGCAASPDGGTLQAWPWLRAAAGIVRHHPSGPVKSQAPWRGQNLSRPWSPRGATRRLWRRGREGALSRGVWVASRTRHHEETRPRLGPPGRNHRPTPQYPQVGSKGRAVATRRPPGNSSSKPG